MNSVRSGESLDPFAFPPETNARFNLLIFGAVITVMSLSITMWATVTLGSNLNRFTNLESGAPNVTENWRIVLFVLGAPVVSAVAILTLLVLAYYKYRQYPARIIMQKHLEPIKPDRDRKFIESVEALAKEAGLQSTPKVLLGPPRAQDGQAFGFRDTPILRLGPNLKVLRLKKELEPIYRAITLHEMAHIVNEDVQRSYFAEATWSALRIVTVPLAAVIVLGYIPGILENEVWPVCIPFVLLPVALIVAFEVGIIFAVLQFIRRGALRVRETYADIRAARWGAYNGLVQILSSAREIKRNRWQRLWKFHPKASERLKYLRHPEGLFRLTLDLPLSLGFLSGMVLAGGSSILVQADQLQRIPGSGFGGTFGLIVWVLSFVIYTSIIFLLSWQASSGIGLQVQRQTVSDRAHGKSGLPPYLRLFLPALVFQLAFEAGVYFMPYDTLQIDPSAYFVSIVLKSVVDPNFPVSTSSLISFLIFPFWIIFTAFMFWTWMGLIRFYTSQLISWKPGDAPTFGQIRTITVFATLLLPFLYIPSALARYWLLNPENRSLIPALLSLPIVSALVFTIFLAGWMWLKGEQTNKRSRR